MAGYATVNGVRTWYDVAGDGEPLVLLHGGFSDSADFDDNLRTLSGQFRVFVLDRRAHGRTADVAGPVGITALADDVIAFLEQVVGEPAHLAGYSSGGFVALAVALRRPELVRRLVLMNTAADKNGWVVLPEPDGGADFPAEVVDRYAELSPDGRDHFATMARKFATVEHEGLDPAGVGCPTLLLGADDDIVHLSHTLEMYRAIPHAALAILPGTHLLLWERPQQCTGLVAEFLETDPLRLMPIRHHREPDNVGSP
ncbi:alpha/beta hydrolase [Nocardia speluncae]|uniref:Alpha/beta hydrolase n=1 Tax=Nocardia speluncae TaxID=419477 RepID=A0A846XF29_9NOCA|nr:alpha/beta hydrolase [Nocardia speluncae]NKY34562.1 alpha/beta hydrolase [Nocardia speluncae]